MTVSSLLLGVAALAVVGVAMVLLEAMIRRTPVGLAVVLAQVVMFAADVPLPVIQVGGIALYAGDVVLLLLAVATTARLLRIRDLEVPHVVLLATALLAGYALLRGIADFGPSAVSESRRWLLPLTTAIYASLASSKPEVLDRIGRLWMWSGVALAFVALGRWAGLATGFAPTSMLQSEAGNLRVLGAAETLIIAQAFFIAAPAWQESDRKRDRLWAVLLLAATLLLQHRTVWISMLCCVPVLFWRQPALGRRFGVLFVVVSILGVSLLTTVFDTDSEQLTNRATSSDTFGWRVEGWQELLFDQQPEDPVDWAIGRPFGSGWDRTVALIVRDVSPHSFYVEGLLRIGAIGVVLLTGLAVAAAWQLLRRPRGPAPGQKLRGRTGTGETPHVLTPDVLLYLTVFACVYGITYHPELTNFLAIALAANVALVRRAPRAAETPAAVDTADGQARLEHAQ